MPIRIDPQSITLCANERATLVTALESYAKRTRREWQQARALDLVQRIRELDAPRPVTYVARYIVTAAVAAEIEAYSLDHAETQLREMLRGTGVKRGALYLREKS